MPRVLIIEDDLDVSSNLAEYLEPRGLTLDFAYDGGTGLRLARARRYDAVVLDLGLPGLDGIEVCARLRREAQGGVPVLMLTARDGLSDKLQGFEAGADDYLVKPFALPELLCRLQALMRRGGSVGRPDQGGLLRVGELELDTASMEARRAGTLLRLNRTDLGILAALLRASPALVRGGELKAEVWGDEDAASDELLRAAIYRLRRAVDRPFGEALICTVHGQGYRVRAPADDGGPGGDAAE